MRGLAAKTAAMGDGGAEWRLSFTALQAGSTVRMNAKGTAPSVSLMYSVDGQTWTSFVVGTTTVTLANAGDKVLFKAGAGGNTKTATDHNDCNFFFFTGKVAAGGSVMSLLDGDEDTFAITESGCFAGMFQQPALAPGTLVAPPRLPATTLANWCYEGMFMNCSALAECPELPATTLTDWCYWEMFLGCSALVKTAELPATVLAPSCYKDMFQDCGSLAEVTTRQTDFWVEGSSSVVTEDWLYGVAANGVFKCPVALGTHSTIARSASACPAYWTVVNI